MFRGSCKVNISIDDVNPKNGWKILGEPVEKYLKDLHAEFGVKVTLFIPSNHHNTAPLSEHKSWIEDLQALEFIEFGCHGHFHNSINPIRWGECEFGELSDDYMLSERINNIQFEWNESLGYVPKLWESPGWLTSRTAADHISNMVDIAVIHPAHNHNLLWKCKTVNAADFFPPNSFPTMDCNMFILSHIHGKHDNVWNENFYRHVKQTLIFLRDNNIPIENSFIKDF